MKSIIIALLFFSSVTEIIAQTTLKGKVTDQNGLTLPGANVMIKGSYDGASADTAGNFNFTTRAMGNQIVLASFIGYDIQEKEISLEAGEAEVNFNLREQKRQINDVVITAGTFEASDQKKSVTLQALDIVTTPSAAGDIYGALASLPGATMVGEDGRLFVRGGDGYESKTFIDGLLVKKPYSSTTPDLPTRGRFSPFLFSGTMFSTGGYSAEYGQALSSALILTTNAFPEKTQTEISLMSVGLGVTQTLRTEKAAVSVGAEYTNLQPYYSVVKQNIDWEKYPQSTAATFVGRYKTKGEGLIKVFSTYKAGSSSLNYPEMTAPGAVQKISLKDKNNYTNINYTGSIGGNWIIKSGLSFTYDEESMAFSTFNVDEQNKNLQGKVTLKNKISDCFSLLLGGEEVINRFSQQYTQKEPSLTHLSGFDDYNTALYAEAQLCPLKGFAIRAGLRGEYSSVINQPVTAIRTSAAWAISKKIQLSVAYGSFYQTPEETLLRFTHNLSFEKAEHYIGNIQYEANDRIFRIEGYHKKYGDLITFREDNFYEASAYDNSGSGYSQGIDVFFRDRRSVSGLDYWVSYSFLDAKRLYRNYPRKVTPSFAARHSFNVVAKKYFDRLNTQFGAIFTWASGRPYHNPNNTEFMGEVTRDYLDLSLNISYLTTLFDQSAIFYTSLSNVFGRNNIFGYRYFSTPNQTGKFDSMPVQPEAKRFFILAVFITL